MISTRVSAQPSSGTVFGPRAPLPATPCHNQLEEANAIEAMTGYVLKPRLSTSGLVKVELPSCLCHKNRERERHTHTHTHTRARTPTVFVHMLRFCKWQNQSAYTDARSHLHFVHVSGTSKASLLLEEHVGERKGRCPPPLPCPMPNKAMDDWGLTCGPLGPIAYPTVM